MEAITYIVRPGENSELRYSLRSVHQHFPDIPVYVVGSKPDWLQNVHFLPANYAMGKARNVWFNLVALTAWDDVPEDIVIMNDDFYITAPVDHIPVLYRGTLEDHLELVSHRDDWWSRSLQHTAELLPEDALSYELHTPFPCRKSLMAETLSIRPGEYPPQWRTLYGNQWHTNPTLAPDVKKRAGQRGDLARPFASTTDAAMPQREPELRALFPNPSPHEADQWSNATSPSGNGHAGS